MKRKLISFLIMLFFALSFGLVLYYITIWKTPFYKKQEEFKLTIPQTDVEEDVDVVKVLLLFHASDYFVYKGVPIGFQYEMLRELEKGIGRNVEIKVETDPIIVLKKLFENCYDIVVMDINYNGFLLPIFYSSIPHSYSYPVLVSENKVDSANNHVIMASNDFPAKLFFNNDSHYSQCPIQKEYNYSTEELFEQLDEGNIAYLICDYNQAITLIPFYSNVQIIEKAGPLFERRWVLNKKNIQLNEDINHWLLDFKKTAKYRWLIKKYFASESSLIQESFAKNKKNDISQYDDIIKKHAQKYGIDWRFVASIICQETKFISGLTGKGGSCGLMQLMPVTMEYYGISEDDGDEENICAGVQHLNTIRKSFDDIEDEEQKLYFIAAAYNAGRGHIFDAQRLCAKFEDDFNDWKDVAKYLKLKSQYEFATDSVVKSGYLPGTYTVKYAQQVMERYYAYKAAYP